jgi:hypothetical protein
VGSLALVRLAGRARGAAALAAALLVGCAGSGDAPPEKSAAAAERPAWVAAAKDVGRTEGDTYVHEGIGLRLTLPEGWVFLPREQVDQVTSEGNRAVAVDDQKLAAEAEAAGQIGSVLFVMVDASSVQGSIPIPTVVGTLEAVDPRLPNPTSLDYATGVKDRIEQSQVRIRFEGEAEPAPLGGAPAARLHATTDSPGGVLHQTYWFCVRGRLLLSLVVSQGAVAQRSRVDEALARLRFGPP